MAKLGVSLSGASADRPRSVLSGPGEWRFRVVWECVDGTLIYSNNFDEESHALTYFEAVSEQVPNPSQKTCWLERREVTRWERFGERKGGAVIFNGS